MFYICSINLYCTLANKYDDESDVFYEYSVFLFFGVYFAVGLYIFRVSCQWPWRTITNKSHMV